MTDLVTCQFDAETGIDSADAILDAFDLEFVDSSLFMPMLWRCETNETIRRIINDCAVDLGDPGADTLYGHGRARADFALLTPMHGDLNNDGFMDSTDLAWIIDQVFFNVTPAIHWSLADVKCDFGADATDISLLIDVVLFGQPPPGLCTWYCGQL